MEGRSEEAAGPPSLEQMFPPDMQMKSSSDDLSVEEMAALVCLPAWQQQHLSSIVKEESERPPPAPQPWEGFYDNEGVNALPASKDTACPSVSQILIITPQPSAVAPKKPTVEKKHKCPVCLKMFLKPSDLRRHEATHSEEKPYTCPTCGVSYRHQRSLSIHHRAGNCGNKEHVKSETATKEAVPKQVSSSKVLVRKFQCPTCEKLFFKPSDLKRHEVTHSALRPYPCEVCGITYRHMRSLKSHARTVHSASSQSSATRKVESTVKKSNKSPVKKTPVVTAETAVKDEDLKCVICLSVFRSKQELDLHLQPKFESANLNLPCLFCGLNCLDTKALEDHVKEAHNMCKVCIKIFKNKEILARHETKHSLGQIVFYKCHCGLEFKVFDKFETHVKTKHENLNFYLNNFIKRPITDIKNKHFICDKRKQCPYCNKYLQDEIILQNHKIKFHKVYKCMLCNNHFIASKNTNSDSIPFQCESCEFNKIQKCTVCNNLFIAGKGTKSDATSQCGNCQVTRGDSFLDQLPHTFTFYGDNNAASSEGGEMSSSDDLRLDTSVKPELLGCEDVKMEIADHSLPAADW